MPLEIKEFVGEGNIKTVSDSPKKNNAKKRKLKKNTEVKEIKKND